MKPIKLYFILSALCCCQLLAQAQVVPSHAHNNLQRIDSLTLEYMKEAPKKECNYLCIEGYCPTDKEFFEEQMNSLGSEIGFSYNEFVNGQMKYFSYADGAFLRRAFANKSKYFPILEETLDRKGLPQELKYISIIESALNPTARSRAGALGLWQFMPGTGRYLDMTINYKVDDRKSIIKSTEFAADYFKTLHGMFDDWLLAIAAYNAGPGNVRKAIARAGGVGDFWYIKKYLPRETQNYVPRFIAAVYLMNFSNNITSLLAFYAYLTLGLDYDSFSPLGGTPHYEKALLIVNNAQNSGSTGWGQFQNRRNRYWLIENLRINSQYEPVRQAIYKYHLQGLDKFLVTPDESRALILESLKEMQAVNRILPNSIIIIAFLDAKNDEIINLFSKGPIDIRRNVYNELLKLDPTRRSKYQKIVQN